MCRYALTSDQAVSSRKYNLLSWSPGQHDMSTFPYSESLKYEIEEDFVNNYSKIPLGRDVSVEVPGAATRVAAEPGSRFTNFRKSMSFKVSGMASLEDAERQLLAGGS